MVQSAGVRVPRGEAEATRRRLLELGVLRVDLEVAKDGGHVVFPVHDSCGPRLPVVEWTFSPRPVRAESYHELLRLPPGLADLAPRAFDQMGDLILVKVPHELEPHKAELGRALLQFHRGVRAVFQDHGVVGEFRTRRLERLAGDGASRTQVAENGVRLWVDPAAAYYSPRLATERQRVAALVRPGEHVVDLFAGVGPFAIQCAKAGAAVEANDLNPAAIELARLNVELNGLADRVHLGCQDARVAVARLKPADRVILNLPHGAKHFLDAAARLCKPGTVLHHHEILPRDRIDARGPELEAELARHGCRARLAGTRVVRHYSSQDEHVAFDLEAL